MREWFGIDQTLVAAKMLPVLRAVARRDRVARLLNRPLAPFNPIDPSRYVDPYPLYENIRARGPVFEHKRLGAWLVTGYEECEQVLRSPSSVDRSHLLEHVAPYKHIDEDILDMVTTMMLMVDPPDHTRLRKLVNRAFTPRAIAQLEPQVEKIAGQLLDELETRSQFDVMNHYASQVPIYMIGQMLGVPSDQWPRLKKLSDTIALFVDPLSGFEALALTTAVREAAAIFTVEFEKRRDQPQDDILSALVAAEEDGDRLSQDELISMCLLLMVAGHETTTGLIGNALVSLDRDRDARAMLLGSASSIDLVDEFLRHDSPVQNTDRFITTPLTIGNQTIPEGALVTIMLGAANRDPRVYDSPDELRLDRPDPRPLSFGHGIHHCLGAALARIEGEIAIRAFVERFPDYRIASLEWKRSLTLRGPEAMVISPRSL